MSNEKLMRGLFLICFLFASGVKAHAAITLVHPRPLNVEEVNTMQPASVSAYTYNGNTRIHLSQGRFSFVARGNSGTITFGHCDLQLYRQGAGYRTYSVTGVPINFQSLNNRISFYRNMPPAFFVTLSDAGTLLNANLVVYIEVPTIVEGQEILALIPLVAIFDGSGVLGNPVIVPLATPRPSPTPAK